jgi:beta-glucosidase
VANIERLGIRTVRVTNGPVGVGQNDCVALGVAVPEVDGSSARATALPSAIAMAASFDRDMARQYGEVIATEMGNLALDIFEAPGVNMARLPILGRNFEYYGEDPYLSGTMAVEEAKVIQGAGIVAMPKHFVGNEQETYRSSTYSKVDDQVLREIYLIPFEMAVKDAKVSSIMCSYNYLNGKPACGNGDILNTILRGDWGFTGYVQTDFGGSQTTTTVDMLLAGMDHEMNNADRWTPDKVKAALESGDIIEAQIDRALERRFTQMFKLGILDRPIVRTPVDFAAGGEKAREIGVKSAVLLKNRGNLLPLSENLVAREPGYSNSTVDYVLVIGKASQPFAQEAVQANAKVGTSAPNGSSDVMPDYTVTPVQGILDAFDARQSSGKVLLVLVDDSNEYASVDGVPTTFTDVLMRVLPDPRNKAVIIMAGTISEEGGDRGTVCVETGPSPYPGVAGPLADFCEYPDVTANGTSSFLHSVWGMSLDWYTSSGFHNPTTETGTRDSKTMEMIDALMAVPGIKEKTVLVLKDNASIAVPDSLLGDDGPAAILEAWFPGQEDGNIVGDILVGKVNPSGKLPVTFPRQGKSFMDRIEQEQFPGKNRNMFSEWPWMKDADGIVPVVDYSEGLHIGYRWYDTNVSGECANLDDCVAFPFGYGLSYTSFDIGNAAVAASDGKYEVKATVKNTGDRTGAEVVQVYVRLPGSANSGGRLTQPPKRLVGFAKVELEAGAQREVSITIDPEASNHPLSVWDKATGAWVTPSGSYTVWVGNSSSPKALTSAGTINK